MSEKLQQRNVIYVMIVEEIYFFKNFIYFSSVFYKKRMYFSQNLNLTFHDLNKSFYLILCNRIY